MTSGDSSVVALHAQQYRQGRSGRYTCTLFDCNSASDSRSSSPKDTTTQRCWVRSKDVLCGRLHPSGILCRSSTTTTNTITNNDVLPTCINSHCSCAWHSFVILLDLGTTALHKTYHTLHDTLLTLHTAFMNTLFQYKVQCFAACVLQPQFLFCYT